VKKCLKKIITAIFSRRTAMMIVSVLAISVLVSLLFPVSAYANWLSDVLNPEQFFENILELLFFIPAAEGLMNGFVRYLQFISANTIIGGSLASMLPGGGGASVADFMRGVNRELVIPVAHSILVLVMMVQLIKISQRADASAQMPVVKEVAFLAVFFTIFTWLIDRSWDICLAIFDVAHNITVAMTVPGGTFDPAALTDTLTGVTGIVNLIPFLLVLLIAFIAAGAAFVLALVITWARALQIYIMMAFAPIPFALLGFEETKSFGVGFLKNFASLCLATTILVMMLQLFPLLVNAAVAFGSVAVPGVDGATSPLGRGEISVLAIVAMCLVLIFGLAKSGSWAKDILGG